MTHPIEEPRRSAPTQALLVRRPRALMCALIWALVLTSTVAAATNTPSCPTGSTEVVPPELLTLIGTALPEKSNAGLEFLHEQHDSSIELTADATVSVTFLWEGAGFNNSLGYFTYGFDGQGDVVVYDRQLVFPLASFAPDGSTVTGDSHCLTDGAGNVRVFPAGTRIGFFLVSAGFDESPQVQSWDPTLATIPSSDPAVNLSEAHGVFTSLDCLNPEMSFSDIGRARHTTTISLPGMAGFLGGAPFLVMGFEDLNRNERSDDDFNDLVISVQAGPSSALLAPNAATWSTDDSDGDGVIDVHDAYPGDATRAVVMRYPANGYHVLGFEDLYPAVGDADYNDAVVVFAYELVTDAQGGVLDILATYHLVARGSAFDHLLGLHLPGIPADATGVVRLERFSGDPNQPSVIEPELSITDLIQLKARRIDNLIPSTVTALPPASGQGFANTQSTVVDNLAASSRVLISFDEPLAPETLGAAPYDLYFGVDHGLIYDVHLPGWPGFSDRAPWLPEEEGEAAFLDDAGNPWLIIVPHDWRFPLEQVQVWSAYPSFSDWVADGGASHQDWFEADNQNAPWLVGNAPQAYLMRHDWQVDLPVP